MYRHLISVEVSIERCTTERMETDRLTTDEHRTECLDTETVKCRSTVEENIFAFDNSIESVPDFLGLLFDDLLSVFDIVCLLESDETTDDKWLEQSECHRLWESTLIHLELRPDDDHRSTRIVDSFTEEILTESTLLSLEDIRE